VKIFTFVFFIVKNSNPPMPRPKSWRKKRDGNYNQLLNVQKGERSYEKSKNKAVTVGGDGET
jgi:hypothetical protein